MIDFLKKITQDRIGTFISNGGHEDDFEFWDFDVYKEAENDFKTYNVIKTYIEEDSKIEWSIVIDEYSAIAEAFDRTRDEECEYPLEEWVSDYENCFETSEEIIKFLEKYEDFTEEEEWV